MKKYLKQLKSNKKGFTLIEMIVVIAIIGVLAAVLVPSMSGYLKNAKTSKQEANARTVYTAAQAAVIKLESITPVKDSPDAGYVSGVDDQANKDGKSLLDEVKNLIGASSYTNIGTIKIVVKDGAVTKVSIHESAEDSNGVSYPK